MTTLLTSVGPKSPSGLKVKAQSYASLEEVADGIRGALPLQQGQPFNLDCKRILEKTLPQAGFNYKIVESVDLDECAAFTIPEMELVVFREDIYEMLQRDNVFGRSTVVHEMAHIVLKHAVTLSRGAQLGKHKFYEDSEWQAKALTAAIMMPIQACREAAGKPAVLAEMCGTSVQSATFRLDNLVRNGRVAGQRHLFWQ
ncbi:ImmA/IrrE family metallo-endopeptidase [Ectopseudomonas mendocina]|uniref:ImmA/IrrE family metallo-endopeptidase n=1 Tax=Ectopseudomonas mendocina TaxID=300 RepID=A0ABZ2RL22_ECTME